MISFDLIDSLFKCWSRFDFYYFNAAVHTKVLKILLKKVIADIFMVVEAILFRLLSLISLIVFSNVVSGSYFSTSILMFILGGSKLSSKDVVILEIRSCDWILTDISLITSVASKRNNVSELRVTNSYSICFGYLCYCSMKSINPSSGCSKSYQIYQTWPGFWLQFNLHKIKFQKWEQEIHLNIFFWELVWFQLLFSPELYQLSFLFFKYLIIWRNLVLEFSLKVICRIWMFRGESNHLILNGS